jgi:hypothetical protein
MKRTLRLAALGGLIVLALAGCMFGKTLEGRIGQFEADLNLDLTGRSGIYLNFHPTLTTDYEAIKDPAFFDVPFPVLGTINTPYEIVITDKTNESAVTATIDSSAMGINSPFNAIFEMALDGMDYKIVSLQVDWKGGAGFEYVVQ